MHQRICIWTKVLKRPLSLIAISRMKIYYAKVNKFRGIVIYFSATLYILTCVTRNYFSGNGNFFFGQWPCIFWFVVSRNPWQYLKMFKKGKTFSHKRFNLLINKKYMLFVCCFEVWRNIIVTGCLLSFQGLTNVKSKTTQSFKLSIFCM